MRRSTTGLALALALGLTSCGGERNPSGLDEPLRVRNAQFREGDLPGTPEGDGAVPAGAPAITALESANALLRLRQPGKVFSGRTNPRGATVGVRFPELGTGWWQLNVGGADPTFDDDYTWTLQADFSDALPTGLRTLRFVAIDPDGRPGPQRDYRVCVLPEVPDNLNACDPTIAPPDTVISLAWEDDVDLDLVVVTPDGRTVDARHPSTLEPVRGVVPPGGGALDRNSNANCAIDGIRRENLVFQGATAPGVYRLYANLFSACGRTATRYRLTTHLREILDEGRASRVRESFRRDGVLTAIAANGGAARGTFVGEVTLP
jgi:hypothetical protein